MTETATLADVARVAADDFRKGRETIISPMLARELATAVELALLTAVRAERRACAAECARRAELADKLASVNGAGPRFPGPSAPLPGGLRGVLVLSLFEPGVQAVLDRPRPSAAHHLQRRHQGEQPLRQPRELTGPGTADQ